MQSFEHEVESLLSLSPFLQDPEHKQARLLPLLKAELGYACQKHAGYKNYIEKWPISYVAADCVANLPFLPVALLKADPPLSFIPAEQVKRTLTSSATTSQFPSRVVIDAATARRMSKGAVTILRDFIGSNRRPYLVVDTPEVMRSSNGMGARAAAIQGLQPFASTTFYCLALETEQRFKLLLSELEEFACCNRDGQVLVYGLTFILWNHLIKPLLEANICLNLPNVMVLHSGGWKRLQDQAVEKITFNQQCANVFGCAPDRIIDFYGMVEAVGIVFPDCPEGNKHASAFGEVIVRDPLTLEPVIPGQLGIIQICSVLPSSFPGNLLLTEDLGQVISYDGCACGRRGIAFRFVGRIPKAEIRGCGNIQSSRIA
jgi:hypothetical protein